MYTSVSGPEYFGYANPVILKLIQDLPNAEKCTRFTRKIFKPKTSKMIESDEINCNSSRRAEIIEENEIPSHPRTGGKSLQLLQQLVSDYPANQKKNKISAFFETEIEEDDFHQFSSDENEIDDDISLSFEKHPNPVENQNNLYPLFPNIFQTDLNPSHHAFDHSHFISNDISDFAHDLDLKSNNFDPK